MQLPVASQRSISSLLNWVNGTGCISRKETRFLHRPDLCAVGGSDNHGLMWMESTVEWIFIQFYKYLKRVRARSCVRLLQLIGAVTLVSSFCRLSGPTSLHFHRPPLAHRHTLMHHSYGCSVAHDSHGDHALYQQRRPPNDLHYGDFNLIHRPSFWSDERQACRDICC